MVKIDWNLYDVQFLSIPTLSDNFNKIWKIFGGVIAKKKKKMKI